MAAAHSLIREAGREGGRSASRSSSSRLASRCISSIRSSPGPPPFKGEPGSPLNPGLTAPALVDSLPLSPGTWRASRRLLGRLEGLGCGRDAPVLAPVLLRGEPEPFRGAAGEIGWSPTSPAAPPAPAPAASASASASAVVPAAPATASASASPRAAAAVALCRRRPIWPRRRACSRRTARISSGSHCRSLSSSLFSMCASAAASAAWSGLLGFGSGLGFGFGLGLELGLRLGLGLKLGVGLGRGRGLGLALVFGSGLGRLGLRRSSEVRRRLDRLLAKV